MKKKTLLKSRKKSLNQESYLTMVSQKISCYLSQIWRNLNSLTAKIRSLFSNLNIQNCHLSQEYILTLQKNILALLWNPWKKSNFPWGEQRAALKDWYIKVVEIRLPNLNHFMIKGNTTITCNLAWSFYSIFFFLVKNQVGYH